MRSAGLALLSTLAALCVPVSAHIALWDPAMYGWDASDPNQQEPVNPLSNLTFKDWWFHGYIDVPPQNGSMMDLPSGGTYHGQVACNKALTTYGANPEDHPSPYACDGDGATGGIGALHTTDAWESANPTDVKGCGIAIAYESDVSKVQPEDFAVISVNYTCPWWKNVNFHIPADLPPCPEGGCHCMWGWIHASDSGSEQMYFTGYRCNVTGATGTQAVPSPKTANKCDYPTDTSNCTVGAKQPHYWYQAERNNNFQGTYDPPFYNGAYGFIDGAQTDLFAGNDAVSSTSTESSATTSVSPSSSLSVSRSSSGSASNASAISSISSSSSSAKTAGSSSVVSSAASKAISSLSPTSTTQTTVYVPTTVHSPSPSSTSASTSTSTLTSDTSVEINEAALATAVSPSSSSSTTSASASAAMTTTDTSSSASQCKRKRELSSLLDTPDKVERHLKRNQRRRERLARKRSELGYT